MSLDIIRDTIREHDMISSGDSVVVGLSGGPDSTCLFHALAALREELNIDRLCAVHINHGLRGAEAERDAEYSRSLAEYFGAEFRIFRFDIAADAKRRKISSEAAGRRARYAAFEQVCREIGAKKTAVAHNRDDQAETVLMRILRGTGTHGLTGIEYIRDGGYGKIIRPLLDMNREAVERYCSENGLTPMRDSTNEEAVCTRNKIRLELLPYLRERYNPAVGDALVRLGRSAGEDDDYLQTIAGKIMDKCWNKEENSLETREMQKLHPAVLKRVLLQAASQSGAGRDLGEIHIRAALSLIRSQMNGKETDFTHGNFVRFYNGKLWFLKRDHLQKEKKGQAAKAAEKRICLQQAAFPMEKLTREGRATVVFSGREIRLRLILPEESASIDEDCGITEVRLDWEKLRKYDNLVFRHRLPEDKIRPKGMKGRKKLQDFMVDRKIPREQRGHLLLLAAENTILLAGTEPAAECCENPESMGIVSIEY